MRRGLLALALALVAAPLAAQETGTPVFMAPYRAFEQMEFGVMFSDPETGSWALEGEYGFGFGAYDIIVNGGYLDRDGDGAATLGGSLRSRVITASEKFPLDGAFTIGAGTILGEGDDVLWVPVGISLGRRIDLEGSKTSFVPYIHPVIAPRFQSGQDSAIDVSLGLGVDIRFGGNFDVRVSGGIGDIDGVAIGLVWVR
ncbi:MAG TPA: hypothetical protein VFY20_05690 [Gemmatimonadales bacterium]|nr:hypothetical protein [Gemmatimonadales bacterium]